MTGKEKTKMRGITINYKASQLVNFNAIKDVYLNGRPPMTVHTDKKKKRKRGEGACVSIITDPEDKIYGISYFKRRSKDNKMSFPFGYI